MTHAMNWCVYMIRCSDDSLYTGVTTDIDRRFKEHTEKGSVGAKYTRARIAIRVVYMEPCASRSEAQVRESQIKKLPKKEKELLIKSQICKNVRRRTLNINKQ